MKRIKYLAMLFFAATLTFTFTACGDDKKEEIEDLINGNGGEVNTNIGNVSALTDTGSELSWTAVATVSSGSAKLTQKTTFHYGYDKETDAITSHYDVMEYDNKDIATTIKNQYGDDKDVTSVTQSGAKLTVVYAPSEYADETATYIRQLYEAMKSLL